MSLNCRYIIILTVLFFFSEKSFSQYYVSDVDPCYLKWKKIEDKSKGAIIFPDYMEEKALSLSILRDMLSADIEIGINSTISRFPITLHPTNLNSNGMVTYTPRRMELLTAPSRDNFSVPWLKHLITHEYRHVAQLSALDTGITHTLSYLFGEQMLGLTAILVPTYFYEGDAVTAETQLSVFGRGKQASFNTPFRALVVEGKKRPSNYYKFGTFNNYSPNEYILGYHITQHATEEAGDDFWAKTLRFAGRNPYLIDPLYFAYRKYSDFGSSSKLISSTLSTLKDFWSPLTAENNSTVPVETPITSYTLYNSPIYIDENRVVAIKYDLDRYYRLVEVDLSSNEERVLCDVGYVSSRIFVNNNKVFWEEVTSSLSWGQKNFASLYSYDLVSKRKNREAKGFNFFYTPYGDGYAAIFFDEQNNPSVVTLDEKYNEIKRLPIGENFTSFNGLACCADGLLYGAIVDNNGTSIIAIDMDSEKVDYVLMPSYNTITNLSSNGNKLYFTSINSGQEEVHEYDIKTKEEYQLTESRYGSTFCDISPSGERFVTTTYGIDGFLLAYQDVVRNTASEWQELPSNEMNYPYREWENVIKIDTINIVENQIASYKAKKGVKKYSKLAGNINPHSWLPFYVDTDKLMDSRELSYGLGVNIMSQNLLNSTVFTAGYGRVEGYDLYKLNVDYNGLPVEMSLDVQYGGGKQYRLNFSDSDDSYLEDYFALSGSLSLPLYLSGGGRSRVFRATVNYQFTNDLIYARNDTIPSSVIGGVDPNYGYALVNPIFETGVHKVYSTLSYQCMAHMSSKNLNPRLGYYVQLGMINNPFNRDFGTLFSAYALGYLPAPLPNGSLTVEAATVYQTDASISYTAMLLTPRGTTYSSVMKRSYSATLDYRVPICYPNGGFHSLLFLKRISAGAFVDYMYYKSKGYDFWSSKNSIGGNIIVDFNSISASAPISFEFSVYKPSDSQGVMCGVSLDISL